MTLETEHKVDRAGWSAGPWDDEPDRVDFKHAGFPCFILRNNMGALCGYVGVPPGHALHGVRYSETPDLDVHGGLTYSAACAAPICHVPEPGEPDDVFWFGFDCAHGGDMCPSYTALDQDLTGRFFGFSAHGCYRTVDYVKRQCESLAEQLAELSTSGVSP